MKVFTRINEIVSSNVNSLLSKFENPEKMLDYSIKELEDVCIKLKTSLSEKRAEKRKLENKIKENKENIEIWKNRASFALKKGEEELSKEAISQKINIEKSVKKDEEILAEISYLIKELEENIKDAEEKRRELKERSIELKIKAKCAEGKKELFTSQQRVNEKLEKRLEEIKAKIETWNSEADSKLIYTKSETKKTSKSFLDMEREEEIEKEFQSLKASIAK